MNKVFILVFALMTTISCFSQDIRDELFKNVIQISDNDIKINGQDFFIDFSIPDTIKSPVIFIQTKVPLNLLPKIYPEFSRIIIITPNWTYYDEISKQQLSEDFNCMEPMASSVIYELERENDKTEKDSIIIMGKFPQMEFADKTKFKRNKRSP